MQRVAFFVFIMLGVGLPAWTQEECDDALAPAKSCAAAAGHFRKCPLLGTYDVTQLANPIIAKCEKTFLNKLSTAGQNRYADEVQLCLYRYARQEGTLWGAPVARCFVEVAARFAGNPTLASQPAARASFDCGQAHTALATAICADASLGRADIVQSRVLRDIKKAIPKKQWAALMQYDKEWRKQVSQYCGVTARPLTQKSLNCVRKEFELNFTDIEECQDADCTRGGPLDREDLQDDQDKEFATPKAAVPRASFDCEAPSSALEGVICGDARARLADIKLARAYHTAEKTMAGQHDDLVNNQREWLGFVNQKCQMAIRGGSIPLATVPPWPARRCVRSVLEARLAQLETCSKKDLQQRISCMRKIW